MSARFTVAVDVGTSRTAAAIARSSPQGAISTEPFRLGRRTDTAPSLVFVAESGLVFGDAAERRGIWQPERLVREVKRRIGDGVPLLIGDERFSPEKLYAASVAWVIDTVIESEGASPAAVSVTIPVTWGAHRVGLVRAALAREGWAEIELITEPEAAVRHYESVHPLARTGIVGVYDLGGGTFDAAIMQKGHDGELDVIGDPRGLDDFGGADLDDLVFRHALASAGVDADDLAGGAAVGESVRLGLSALRRECTDAKESLSFDAEAVVPVLVGAHRRSVRVVRSEFEAMIESGISRTIVVFRDALARADVTPPELDAILLTGGSSRIPRIAQQLSEEFDRPILIDTDPKATVSRGAARVAAERHLHADAAAGDETFDEIPAAQIFPTTAQGTRRRRFAVGPALAVTGGALVLAAGIAFTIGIPRAVPATADIEPRPSPSASVRATTADSVELGLRERIGERPPVPEETPLLSPAPDSDRIRNLQDPLATDPTTTEDAP